MPLFLNLIVVLQILTALVMIGLVLIQHGKGADMGASFGSGASGSLFGATGSANFLSRSTAVCAAVFFACTLALAFLSNDRSTPPWLPPRQPARRPRAQRRSREPRQPSRRRLRRSLLRALQRSPSSSAPSGAGRGCAVPDRVAAMQRRGSCAGD